MKLCALCLIPLHHVVDFEFEFHYCVISEELVHWKKTGKCSNVCFLKVRP